MVKKFRKMKLRKIGGAPPVNTSFAKPQVNSTTAEEALTGVQHDQKVDNEKLENMNRTMNGGRRQRGGSDVTVPQFNQTGSEGNDTIANTIDSTLTGGEQGRYDADVGKPAPDSGMPKGGARKRRRRKTRKRRRRNTRTRRRTRKKRKSRRRKTRRRKRR